jgi:hypothetical protein
MGMTRGRAGDPPAADLPCATRMKIADWLGSGAAAVELPSGTVEVVVLAIQAYSNIEFADPDREALASWTLVNLYLLEGVGSALATQHAPKPLQQRSTCDLWLHGGHRVMTPNFIGRKRNDLGHPAVQRGNPIARMSVSMNFDAPLSECRDQNVEVGTRRARPAPPSFQESSRYGGPHPPHRGIGG